MTTSQITDANSLGGAQVFGSDGGKLGKVDAVYLDNRTERPEWVAVKSGLFGSHVSLVPPQRASWDGRNLSVPFDRAALERAPHHDPDREISDDDERELYRHYGLDTGAGAGTAEASGSPATATAGHGRSTAGEELRDRSEGAAGAEGRDTSGPTTDEAMTRSEEQLHVGTEQREVGRARLRKHIVTENVSTTVPVSHEEVTLEREPITEANRGDALSGGELTEEEHEVSLTAERAVTSKETVPVERVRMGTETVTEQQQVDETVRKEEIEAEETEGVDVPGTRSGVGRHALSDETGRGDSDRGDTDRGDIGTERR